MHLSLYVLHIPSVVLVLCLQAAQELGGRSIRTSGLGCTSAGPGVSDEGSRSHPYRFRI